MNNLTLAGGSPDVLEVTVTLGQTVEGVVTLAAGTDEAAESEGLVLAGVATVLVNLADGELDGGVVVGLDDAVGGAALAGHVAVEVSLWFFAKRGFSSDPAPAVSEASWSISQFLSAVAHCQSGPVVFILGLGSRDGVRDCSATQTQGTGQTRSLETKRWHVQIDDLSLVVLHFGGFGGEVLTGDGEVGGGGFFCRTLNSRGLIANLCGSCDPLSRAGVV